MIKTIKEYVERIKIKRRIANEIRFYKHCNETFLGVMHA